MEEQTSKNQSLVAVGDDLGVKASGGIKTLEDAKLFIEAGATRIGTSASLQLIKEK